MLVTGVSSGLGVDTLRALHTTGAHVYGTVRDTTKGQQVVDQILGEKHEGGGKISLVELDLSSFASVRKGAADLLSKTQGKLNIIVANAGVMACPFGLTVDGWETQFGTNHLGHFLLFQLLKDALLASATPDFPSRYVSVSSTGHQASEVHFDDYNYKNTKYEPWNSYGQAKTANIWMANSIERHYGKQNLHATSVHPGGIFPTEGSSLARHLTQETIDALSSGDERNRKLWKSGGQGAATQVWAAVAEEWKNKGGKYLSNCEAPTSYEEKAKQPGMWGMANDGWKPWVYDEAKQERLWKESFGMVGLKEE